jgi:hypothetical protein
MFKKKNKIAKASPVKETFNQPKEMHSEVKIYSIAIVLDGEVQDVIRTETKLAAMLLSDPIFVDTTDLEEKPGIGTKYDLEKGEFVHHHEENQI